jgi:putative ABC transport system ATP-binding protein
VEEYKKARSRKDALPKHKTVLFKGLMSEKRAFRDFRTVLHTGLYSQIVAIEVPVSGEIRDKLGCCSGIMVG